MENADRLAEAIREIRDRVRARHPQPGDENGIAVVDLMPLVHARDAAEGKVAAIGTVNPRPGGALNAAIQWGKRLIARALDWHVREQVEFNRNLVSCVNAILEALNGQNRILAEVGREAGRIADLRSHWAEWRVGWESKLSQTEITLLRTISELQAAYQHRLTLAENSFRESIRLQHADFAAELAKAAKSGQQAAAEIGQRFHDIQQRFWGELENARLELERTIHKELRVVRQRAAMPAAAGAHPAPLPLSPPSPIDWLAFAERFRGPEEAIIQRQRFYVPRFQGRRRVLDVGCGRGEFLELMRDAGVDASGIDASAECVAVCRAKGLRAERAELFEYLEVAPEGSLEGIFCAQVVEHLPPERLPEFVKLAASRLDRDGLLVIETPNPECLAIFATHFYLDPTHTRPVPHPLLAFYMQEYGLGPIEVVRLSPALDDMPALGLLPTELREAFFGGLDYAIFGRKLS